MIHSTFHLKIWLKKWIYCYWENSDRFLHLKLLKSLHWYINQLTWFHLILNIFGQTYNVYLSYHMPLWLLYSLVKAKHTYLKLFWNSLFPVFFGTPCTVTSTVTTTVTTTAYLLLKLVCTGPILIHFWNSFVVDRPTDRQTD